VSWCSSAAAYKIPEEVVLLAVGMGVAKISSMQRRPCAECRDNDDDNCILNGYNKKTVFWEEEYIYIFTNAISRMESSIE
jgi:hypothetical protein